MDRRLFLRSSLAAGVAAGLPSRQLLAAKYSMLTEIAGDFPAISVERKPIMLEKVEVRELADSLGGNLLLPGNDAYERARRVLNAGIDKHPAFVIQPSGVADIRHAVQFAQDHNLLVAVKCGGHSFAGKSTCDGGMQIDLSTFRHARVDPKSRTAYIAGGSLLGELDRESMAFGLATTAGTVSHTGVGGLALAGGFGRLGRRFGLALDNVKAVDIVTADGKLRRADPEKNPDLYWGVRGGGGNFGVVTSFEFELHPVDRQVFGGEVYFPMSRKRDVLNFYSEFARNAPDDLYCDLMVIRPPGGEGAVVGMHICYSGALQKTDDVLAPVRKLGKPVVDTMAVIDYVKLQSSWDNTDPRNTGEYMKSGFFNEFPQALVDLVAEDVEPHPERSLFVLFQHAGGAIGRVPMDETAFVHRNVAFSGFASVSYPLQADPSGHIAFVRDYWKKYEPFTNGYYTVDVADEPESLVHANYQANLQRLREVKRTYDPENLFRLNANIAP
jgi:FAD/FMN-containing dehydrogenase